jgi:hypothetical protein
MEYSLFEFAYEFKKIAFILLAISAKKMYDEKNGNGGFLCVPMKGKWHRNLTIICISPVPLLQRSICILLQPAIFIISPVTSSSEAAMTVFS